MNEHLHLSFNWPFAFITKRNFQFVKLLHVIHIVCKFLNPLMQR